jgi:hypothetical protein
MSCDSFVNKLQMAPWVVPKEMIKKTEVRNLMTLYL